MSIMVHNGTLNEHNEQKVEAKLNNKQLFLLGAGKNLKVAFLLLQATYLK